MVIDVTANQYDAYISREGGSEVTIASGYNFRASATSLDTYALYTNECTLSVENFSIDGIIDIEPEPEYQYPIGAILFDFGGGNSPDYWNNVSSYSVGTVVTNAIDCDGVATSVGLDIYDAFPGANYAGPSGLDDSLGLPDYASYDNFYGGVGDSDSIGGIMLTGLNANKEYVLSIFSSRKDVTENREVQFVITGSSVDTLWINSSSNTNLLSGSYYPDTDGTIKVEVSHGPNNENEK